MYHVLIAHKFYGRDGGPEKLIYGLEGCLKRNGHRCIPFSMKAPYNETNRYFPYFVSNIDYNSSGSHGRLLQKVLAGYRIIYSVEARRKLSFLLNREVIDIAHLHNIYHQISPSILPLLKKKGIPVVMTLHDLKLMCPNYRMFADGRICEDCKKGHYYHAILNKCVKNSLAASFVNCIEAYTHHLIKVYEKNVDRFICPSQFMKYKMREYGYSEEKLEMIPNGVDLREFAPDYSHNGYILYFGRLDKEKGIFTLLIAASLLKSAQVVFAGTGNYGEALKGEAERLRLNNVRFPGFVTVTALKELVRGAMFTITPSEWYENCSSSVLESFAYGKPVIGSRIGGIPEQIEDGVNGLLFEPGNVKDLAEKIDYLSSHPDLIVKMGKNARKIAEEKYSMDIHYRQTMDLYSTLLMF
jgi:glycosyltransferase involved in cell wall biosynthesis